MRLCVLRVYFKFKLLTDGQFFFSLHRPASTGLGRARLLGKRCFTYAKLLDRPKNRVGYRLKHDDGVRLVTIFLRVLYKTHKRMPVPYLPAGLGSENAAAVCSATKTQPV